MKKTMLFVIALLSGSFCFAMEKEEEDDGDSFASTFLTEPQMQKMSPLERDLCNAAEGGDLESIESLKKNNPDFDLNVNDGVALPLAAGKGHEDCVTYLLENGVNPNVQNWLALIGAATNGHVAVVKVLLEQKRCKPKQGILDKALENAIFDGYENLHGYENLPRENPVERERLLTDYRNIIQLLCDGGANQNTALELGKKRNDPNYDVAINTFGLSLSKLLVNAIFFDQIDEVTKLVEDSSHEVRVAVFELAALHNGLKVMAFLLDKYNIDINAHDGAALCNACRSNNVAAVKFLLAKDNTRERGRALVEACKSGYDQVVNILLADPNNEINYDNGSPLKTAIKSSSNSAKLILSHSNVEVRLLDEESLNLVAQHSHIKEYTEIATLLVNKGIDRSKVFAIEHDKNNNHPQTSTPPASGQWKTPLLIITGIACAAIIAKIIYNKITNMKNKNKERYEKFAQMGYKR